MTDLAQLTADLLDRAVSKGADAADAVVSRGASLSIEVRDGALEHAERAEGVEIGIRALVGQKQACVSASDVRPETLDEIANGVSEEFRFARLVLMNADEDLADLASEDLKRVPVVRRRHADLDRRVRSGRITPRELRVALVAFYSEKGRQELNQRFFGP